MIEINENTRRFVQEHRQDDVRKLALQTSKYPDIDMSFVLNQIAGWQTARKKLPSWAATDGIVYPPHLNMEQCSSELTARYKAQIINSLPFKGEVGGSFHRFIDLTGGFGVDFYFMSQDFEERVYVEQNPLLCTISSNNFKCLGLQATIVNNNAETYLKTMDSADIIFMDPARRNEHGGRAYGIADCTPNVLELMPLLATKTQRLVLKLSPMLDWRKAVKDLNMLLPLQEGAGKVLSVSEIHIISVQNECKELVIVMGQQTIASGVLENIQIVCVNLLSNGNHEVFNVNHNENLNENSNEKESSEGLERLIVSPSRGEGYGGASPARDGLEEASYYLFEPNASVMKAGCFTELAQRFRLQSLATNSHLFLTSEVNTLLPGRLFRVNAVSSMNKKEVKKILKDIDRANITVRNFPLSTAELRKRLKLKDGGDCYLFATTLSTGDHVLILTHKYTEQN